MPLTLKLGAYYYALQLVSACKQPMAGTVSQVIDRAQALTKQPSGNNIQEVSPTPLPCLASGDDVIALLLFQDIQKMLDLYVRLMADHDQACYLQSLGKDVDAHRFTADDAYKQDTILSLTQSVTTAAAATTCDVIAISR